jgi:hypothetical protein
MEAAMSENNNDNGAAAALGAVAMVVLLFIGYQSLKPDEVVDTDISCRWTDTSMTCD